MFKLDGTDRSRKGAVSNITAMAMRVDEEYPHLLVAARDYRACPALNRFDVPWMVSDRCPVSVAVTKWADTDRKGKGGAETKVVVAGAYIDAPDGVEVKLSGLGQPGPAAAAVPGGDGTAKNIDEPEAPKAAAKDFKGSETVTLSVSTVLNSPSVLDRVEHASTYVWIEAYPFPPDGDTVLEEEFWHRFFNLNEYRHVDVRGDTVSNDMCRALDEMRVRIVDVATTVNPKMIELGQLSRTEMERAAASVEGTVGAPVLPGASIKPSVTFVDETSATMVQKLAQELDHRSTYIDPFGHFLRVTQRGVQSANLAGRFLEKITLHIPARTDPVPVLVPEKEGRRVFKWVVSPLYSRVDALTFSVVVARQTTELRKTTRDCYRLADPTDAAFVAGVTFQERITLWEHERKMEQIIAADVNRDLEERKGAPVLMAFDSSKDVRHPLIISGFEQEEKMELLGLLSGVCDKNKPDEVCFLFDTNGVLKRCELIGRSMKSGPDEAMRPVRRYLP